MKVLVIGSGGREHALVWKLAQSKNVSKIYALPGNAGISQLAECVPGSAMNIKDAANFAESQSIDLTIVGPESPLIAGIVDEFEGRGLKIFGPNKQAAQMEGSKAFAKKLMLENGIPTGLCEIFDDPDKADDYIKSVAKKTDDPIVIKADGEAAGKGVIIARNEQEALQAIDLIMRRKAFGASGNRVVIEEFLDGQEASYMVFVDGESFQPMMPAQDYKRAYDNDEGLNTGGMGCYSPVPVVNEEVSNYVKDFIVKPTLKALMKEGVYYKGVLYAGLALTSNGPKVVEFNARFGDPETQVVLPLLESDLFEITYSIAEGNLDETAVNWYNRKALCVVMASGGYPGDYEKGKIITGIDEAEKSGVIVFHAGTEMRDGKLVTSGGRVLGVTAVGDTYKDCIEKAYAGVSMISFKNAHYRRDIGARLL